MRNEKSTSLLDEEEIVKMGVSVFEVNGVPGNNMPYMSPHYIISVCHSGSIDVEYDDNPAKFTPQDLAIVYPMHTLVVHRVSSDYHATLIAVSSELYTKFGKLFLVISDPCMNVFPTFTLPIVSTMT